MSAWPHLVRRWVPRVAWLALSTGGCTVGPNYVKPSVQAPTSYKEAGDWKIAQPGDEITRGAWWRLFGQPALNDLEAKIDVSNQTLAASEAQYRAAMAAAGVVRAAYLPTVTAGASVVRSNPSENLHGGTITSVPGGTTTTGLPATSANATIYTLPIGVSWELDLWGRIRRSVESSRASAQASAADVESARLSANAALAQDYFQLRSLDAQKSLLDRATVDFERVLDLTKNRYLAGVASRADVAQAQTQLENTRAQAIDIGVARAQMEHAIATLVGVPPSSLSLSFAPLQESPPEIPLFVPSEILERRPDVAAAERRVASANAQIGVAVAAYFPKLTLGASGGLSSSSLSNWFSVPSAFWSIGPSLAGTIFDGGARSAQVDQARALYDAAVANYRQTALTAFQDVEDNLAAVRILAREATAQNQAVDSARQAVTVTTNQYRAGTIAYLDLLVAETTALTTERTAVDLLGRRMVATVLLVKALGGGWNRQRDSAISFVPRG